MKISRRPRSLSQLCKASISETDPMHTPKSGIQSIRLPSDLPSGRYHCSRSHYRERGCPSPRVYATPDMVSLPPQYSHGLLMKAESHAERKCERQKAHEAHVQPRLGTLFKEQSR